MSLHRDRSKSGLPRDLLLLALAALVFFGVAVGRRDLWNPNEPSYGRATVEMFERGDWLIPSINGQVFAEKPILFYWGALAASHLQGEVNEFSLRVPSVLAAVASVLLTYLLVLPYAGRRRALLAVAVFATQFQVFWAARAIQMDVLVLATTLGALVPLTRMLDFGMAPARAWVWAGLASGLGFAAKGPVALVIPGLAILLYALSDRRLLALIGRGMWAGGIVALVVGAPWYLLLWVNGETDILHEVLIRQNFSRFSEAWDHKQPWWYFIKYLWIDYAPWALLLPAAWLTRPNDPNERRLTRLSWIWLIGTITFFSLSDSKRAPYILPIAPAVAFLAASVVDHWTAGTLNRKARRAALSALVFLGFVLTAGGVFALLPNDDIPSMLDTVARVVGVLLAGTGIATGIGIACRRRQPRWAPAALLTGFASLYLLAAVWALPAVNPLKSARGFASTLRHEFDTNLGEISAYGMWKWRAGYAYYLGQRVPNLATTDDLERHWRPESALVLTESRKHNEPAWRDEIADLLPNAELVLRQRIGNRIALLYRKAPSAGRTGIRSSAHQTEIQHGRWASDTIKRLTLAELPAAVARHFPGLQATAGPKIERRGILAYEIETNSLNGSVTERFVDSAGNTLFTIDKAKTEVDSDRPEQWENLSQTVQNAIQSRMGDSTLVRLQREVEWGVSVIAAKWRGTRGLQELKVLDDGSMLYLELPAEAPIPDSVRSQATGAEIEAMVLDVYSIPELDNTGPPRYILATGLAIVLPSA